MRAFFAIALVGLFVKVIRILSSSATSLLSPYAGEESRQIKSRVVMQIGIWC